jgi:5'-phosphate synthase pdxT subunit
MLRIGILSVQGAVAEHQRAVTRALASMDIEGEILLVRSLDGLNASDALIIPGGESTTISKLINKFKLYDRIRERVAEEDFPIMGTCAGSIMLASEGDAEVKKTDTKLLELMDYSVNRNAFGSQRESFELPLEIDGIAGEEKPFPGVFIRAPLIIKVRGKCKELGTMPDGSGIIAAKQYRRIGLVFHPELTDDLRIHQFFINLI